MRREGVVVLVLLLAACGGGSDLSSKDPQGANACQSLKQAFADKNDTDKAVQGSEAAGAAADQAKTPAIHAATIDLAGTKVADPQKMVSACRDAGMTMPDVPSGG